MPTPFSFTFCPPLPGPHPFRRRRSVPLCQAPCPEALTTSPLPQLPVTPLTPLTFRNLNLHIKRDDLLTHPPLRASKLRKFHSLLSPCTLPSTSTLISFGGAQSNAMLSLALLAHHRDIPFYYITRPVSPRLSHIPGNYARALHAGMRHLVIGNDEFAERFVDVSLEEARRAAGRVVASAYPRGEREDCERGVVFVPQGGASGIAEPGIRVLANELRVQIEELRKSGLPTRGSAVVFLPSGTGTTAYYLAKHLGPHARVLTVPVSGDERYLIRQMRRLAALEGGGGGGVALPGVLRPRLRGSFADVRVEKLAIWRELCRAAGDFEFDLVYAPKVWEEFMLAVGEGRVDVEGLDLIYYHSGGVEGNVSMIDRFKRKGLWTDT